MFKWFLSKRPYKHITVNGTPYLTRWYLCKLFGRHWVLHQFHSPDPDRGLHNHPWDGVSFVLKGAYYEQRLEGLPPEGARIRERRVNWYNRIKPLDFHRVCALVGETTWTLFGISEDKYQGWGFLRTDGLDNYYVQDWKELNSDDTFDVKRGNCPLWKED